MDGCLDSGSRERPVGADLVTQELDLFNLKYQRLCEALRDRLQEVGDGAEDSNIKVVTYPHISMQQEKRKMSSYTNI